MKSFLRFTLSTSLLLVVIYTILSSYGSLREYHADEIRNGAIFKEYKRIVDGEKITFSIISYDENNCLVDKNASSLFGEICVLDDKIIVGDLSINYYKKGWKYSALPRVKLYNSELYIFYIHESFIYASRLERGGDGKVTLKSTFEIEYLLQNETGKTLEDFDYEMYKNQILLTGDSAGEVYFFSFKNDEKIVKANFKKFFNQTYWNKGLSRFIVNNSNIYILFRTGYFIKSMQDEPIYLITKFNSPTSEPSSFRSFRDIYIGNAEPIINSNSLIKIDDDEDIYFKSYSDGNVYSINYNSLSSVDTLTEFTKKKIMNFLSID